MEIPHIFKYMPILGTHLLSHILLFINIFICVGYAGLTFEDFSAIRETGLTPLTGEQEGKYPRRDYIVVETVRIPRGDTVTFRAGSRIYFNRNARITVFGTLQFLGEHYNKITIGKLPFPLPKLSSDREFILDSTSIFIYAKSQVTFRHTVIADSSISIRLTDTTSFFDFDTVHCSNNKIIFPDTTYIFSSGYNSVFSSQNPDSYTSPILSLNDFSGKHNFTNVPIYYGINSYLNHNSGLIPIYKIDKNPVKRFFQRVFNRQKIDSFVRLVKDDKSSNTDCEDIEHIFFNKPNVTEALKTDSVKYDVEPEVMKFLSGETTIKILGQDVAYSFNDNHNSVTFSAPNIRTILSHGLHLLNNSKKSLTVWQEEKKLLTYSNPYKTSYAVIVAINDYQRTNDKLKRGPTGFSSRDSMVEKAMKLETVLEKLSFPKENIISLYDAEATSDRIEDAFERFWQGNDLDKIDRLLVYFGGHGDTVNNGKTPIYITYDYDSNKPSLTSFRMRELVTTHSENIKAHHIIFLIDACFSGLIIKPLGNTSSQYLEKLKRLSTIRTETDQVARNIIVASTRLQGTFWHNGGIFTSELIKGLGGKADLNNDGLIEFEELSSFLRSGVSYTASLNGVKQVPECKVLDDYGNGRVIFKP